MGGICSTGRSQMPVVGTVSPCKEKSKPRKRTLTIKIPKPPIYKNFECRLVTVDELFKKFKPPVVINLGAIPYSQCLVKLEGAGVGLNFDLIDESKPGKLESRCSKFFTSVFVEDDDADDSPFDWSAPSASS
jgi:hypothetical protein